MLEGEMGDYGAEDDPVVGNMPSVAGVSDEGQAQEEVAQKENSSNVSKKKKKRKVIFQYGNYNRYYGYRVGSTLQEDPRMSLMRESWFDNKDVIDVGCNEGHVTVSLGISAFMFLKCVLGIYYNRHSSLLLAAAVIFISREGLMRKLMVVFSTVQKYRVRSMCGIDIDPGLIHKAWKNLEHEAGAAGGRTVRSLYQWRDYVYENETDGLDCDDEDLEQPTLMDSSADATTNDKIEGGLKGVELRERVIFKNSNVLQCNLRNNIVDTVLCLSVVKWIHLNWGDEGLLDFFIMTYKVLRPGGSFILEPQPWSSYERKCRVSEICRKNFRAMILRPDHFPGILLEQIGFKSCEEISLKIPNSTKGFSRPLYLFTK